MEEVRFGGIDDGFERREKIETRTSNQPTREKKGTKRARRRLVALVQIKTHQQQANPKGTRKQCQNATDRNLLRRTRYCL